MIWDYPNMTKNQQWVARMGTTEAKQTQAWQWKVGTSVWVGQQYIVTDPGKASVKKSGTDHHRAYLQINTDDILTCLSPPVWVWSDRTRMAAEWCMVAATYTTNTAIYVPPTQLVHAGLVHFATVTHYPTPEGQVRE